jgi:predicted helicase
MSFHQILEKYRSIAFSEKDKGHRFERLMQAYLRTDPLYADQFSDVWLWSEFPHKQDFGGSDTGIDLVAKTQDGNHWAIQCKFYDPETTIDKPSVDSFLATSSKKFHNADGKSIPFTQRLWISTSNKWGSKALEAFKGQVPPVSRLNLYDLEQAAVDWAKLDKGIYGEKSRNADRKLRDHQKDAVKRANEHFKTNDRGQLIMACGTGKTFTALRLAEKETGGKGIVLFLVPSISLLGQTLREWSTFAKEPIHPICICSDPEVSQKKSKNDDNTISIVDLALPATTEPKAIVKQLTNRPPDRLTVVFSTYQSIEVISAAQKQLAKATGSEAEFDLIICDEAHRTTGVTLADDDESAFVKVHDNKFLRSKKRLYMTATPRLYRDDAKTKAKEAEAYLCSMDDPKLYGPEIYRIGFGQAVEKDLLTDYKVLILTINDRDIPPTLQNVIANSENEINADDVSKLIGCINALSKRVLGDQGIIANTDPEPMRRAVAFCQSIKVSRKITSMFNEATEFYLESLPTRERKQMVTVESQHIDGTMSAPERDELLGWLKGQEEGRHCRILTNVRCLSEGVDVPTLDSVLFLSAKNSQVDVVQSVGRVMRKSPGKKYGYIIIPVVVPFDADPMKALDDNERYKVVWTVLNALRAHDDRFNATVNKIELNRSKPDNILIGRPNGTFDENGEYENVRESEGDYDEKSGKVHRQLMLRFDELQSAFYARMVNKVGDRMYWEQWAKSVADIAERQVERIGRLVRDGGKHQKAFDQFLKGLQKNINPSITEQEAIEMLSQHIITKPVFEALFEDYSFVRNNAISKSMQKMLDLLEEQAIDKDTETLDRFYESVRTRASGIDNAEGKQRIVIELYDKFFKTAFPKLVEKLGIVYTPVEVVDFIIHSVEDILQKEFGRSLSDENVHILDPFTGTGTFITRLIQSGLIKPKDLARKYANELHANEIVLLAYYIAAVNIENAYHDLAKTQAYEAFEGICLTDTFQLGETDDGEKMFSEMFPQNSARVQRQKMAPLRVIIGNPPYSVGQKSANDNAQNQSYARLEKRIAETYAATTTATNKNSLYDSYIKAFRWSTDRLDPDNGGVIAFVSNCGWLDGNSSDGFRKMLEDEFTSIYVLNLRGNARTSGDLRQREAGNVFGSGSRTPIAITLLVKNPKVKAKKATISYHDIGDYLSREEKLNAISKAKSINRGVWDLQLLHPNQHSDWIVERNDKFAQFLPLGDKENKSNLKTFFVKTFSNGLKTQRDSWCYSSSKELLESNISRLIGSYNKQVDLWAEHSKSNPRATYNDVIIRDAKTNSWTCALEEDLDQKRHHVFYAGRITQTIYRPFFKQYLYFDRSLNERVYQMPKLFPDASTSNLLICVSGLGGTKDSSVIMTSLIADLNCLDAGTQCFPLYWYETLDKNSFSLFDKIDDPNRMRHDGVTDYILQESIRLYGDKTTKEDIFYYVYGFLHSPDYRETFANDLKKSLPRLPSIDDADQFWAFSKAGRQLGDLHVNYESVPPYPSVTVTGADLENYRVEKMRFPAKGKKDTIHVNSLITVSEIPAKAYEYVVNGKSAIEWVMERYQVTTHKESGITNDPNEWATEVGNPRYILDLLLSIINVSVQTVDIVASLPKVKFD